GKTEYKVDGTNKQGHLTHIYKDFPGIMAELERRHAETTSDWVRYETEKYMRETVCPECFGARLRKEALGIKIDGLSISEITAFTVTSSTTWIKKLTEDGGVLSEREKNIATSILKEIDTRLNFLISVGLEYLTLDRTACTLAGGEAQRIRLASQIGSGLTGVLYVLDEPTIGLHQRDNDKLIGTLKKLRDLGNSVIVVEHDEATIKSADFVADFGPGAGKEGGYVVATGTPEEIAKNPKSITGKFLCGKRKVEVKNEKWEVRDEKWERENTLTSHISPPTSHILTLKGCQQFNLKNIDVTFPLGKLVAITGVSGSGKSTLLVETLYSSLQQYLNPRFRGAVGKHKDIQGIENVNKAILIDQSPIGRTPRSNPATYTKVFDHIRDVFALTREARAAGFKKGRFSFNVKDGRCGACEGQGQTKIEMQFMNDIWINCEVCGGARYNAQTLEISYKGKNISQILEMNVTEAIDFFHAHPAIINKLETLEAVGLGYIELGQPATMLSGGEAQRVKLSSELAKKGTGSTVYILDEPTTGLHFADIEKLLRVLKLLVRKGNSVFIIEHNLDVIRNTDWVIDLGPGGGDSGGEIVAEGTVRDIKKVKASYTGQFLSKTA
ncbi:excinuclease ABC subunit UvrA, partial [Patescibacteria group bacterium]|nr:excinuclease ABC subunit UvrA [Patescibacteria group bacterium]